MLRSRTCWMKNWRYLCDQRRRRKGVMQASDAAAISHVLDLSLAATDGRQTTPEIPSGFRRKQAIMQCRGGTLR